jgi:hypothetical protein
MLNILIPLPPPGHGLGFMAMLNPAACFVGPLDHSPSSDALYLLCAVISGLLYGVLFPSLFPTASFSRKDRTP